MSAFAGPTSFAQDDDRRDQEEESLIETLFAHVDESESSESQKVGVRRRKLSGASRPRDSHGDREEEGLLQALFAHVDERENP
jgi:hypothetical protein